MDLLLTFFLVSLVTSFLCSMWEAVLLSISPAHVQIMLKERPALGKVLERFKDNIDQPLAAILSLNTVAHTVGAIGVGQQATLIWGSSAPLVTGVLVPVGMTLAILLLSEILPKTLGTNNWRRLTPFTVMSLSFLVKALAPLIWLCRLVTRTFAKDAGHNIFTRSDLLALTEIGTEEGELHDVEAAFIRNLMNFRKIRARDIMTPRTVVVSAPERATFREFYDMQEELIFSRIPLYGTDSADLTGYVLKDEVLESMVDGEAESTQLHTIRRQIISVADGDSIFEIFNTLMKNHDHIANVVDTYGSSVGIVTMEDIVETLLGFEIVDETDKITDLQQYAKRKWQMRQQAKPKAEQG